MDDKKLQPISLRSFMILLYILVVAFIPIAIRLRFVNYISPIETWHRLQSVNTAEVFAQFRLEVLVIVSILLVIAALIKYYYEYEKHTIKITYVDYPIAIFAFLVVLSGLLSPYMNLAFLGFYDRAEGTLAYITYLIIFLLAAKFINAEHDKKIIFYAAIAGGMLQSLIAITQFFGADILQNEFAMRLFIPSDYMAQVEDVTFRFANKAYGTTYNPNYLGGYMAMIFPIVFIMFLYAKDKKATIIWGILLALAMAGFFSPTSIAAFIAAGMALLVFIGLTFRDFKRYYKKFIVVLAIVLLVFAVSEALSGGQITRRLTRFIETTPEAFQQEQLVEEDVEPPVYSLPEEKEINLEIYRTPFDEFASKRGYIWRKSFEIMEGNYLIGEGLDTFVYEFPHWDPERDYDVYRVGQLIDKPHNTYLQIALGVGGLGLLVYLYIMGSHLIKYLKLYRLRGVKTETDVIMLALFIGWLGYLIQGISNDSVLSNAPVFWALFGISVNYVQNMFANNHSEEVIAPSLQENKKEKSKNKNKKKGKKRK